MIKSFQHSIVVLTFFLLISCKKEDAVRCHECDLNKTGQYSDAGCMTNAEWETVKITEPLGNGTLDKNRYCRTK